MSFPVQAEAHGGFFSGTLGTLKEWKLLFVEEVEWTLMWDGNSLGPVKKTEKQEDNASGKFWVPSVWIGERNTSKKLS